MKIPKLWTEKFNSIVPAVMPTLAYYDTELITAIKMFLLYIPKI
jgi:hypothetical protein